MSTTYGLHRAVLLNRNGTAVMFEDRRQTFAELADRVDSLANFCAPNGDLDERLFYRAWVLPGFYTAKTPSVTWLRDLAAMQHGGVQPFRPVCIA